MSRLRSVHLYHVSFENIKMGLVLRAIIEQGSDTALLRFREGLQNTTNRDAVYDDIMAHNEAVHAQLPKGKFKSVRLPKASVVEIGRGPAHPSFPDLKTLKGHREKATIRIGKNHNKDKHPHFFIHLWLPSIDRTAPLHFRGGIPDYDLYEERPAYGWLEII